MAHPDKPRDWAALSKNPNITMKDVLAHPDKNWNWASLSSNPNIFLKIFISNISHYSSMMNHIVLSTIYEQTLDP